MSIFKNLARILLSGAMLFCLWGCGEDITHSTEVYEYKIPMGGDSVLAYKATSYYEDKGEDNCSFMGCTDPGYHRRLNVTIDYCVESGGVQKSCVKGIPYFTNTDQPLVSTYEKGVYILDFVSDANAIGGVKYLQKIWNWETGGYSEDTLVQSEDLNIFKQHNGITVDKIFKLLTVAQTDSGYFLRLRRVESNYEGESYYLNTNQIQKKVQNANMDISEILNHYGVKQNVLKCKLGQWSYMGVKFCGRYVESIENRDSIFIMKNEISDKMCLSLGGGFFRMYFENKGIVAHNVRRFKSMYGNSGIEEFQQDEDCK